MNIIEDAPAPHEGFSPWIAYDGTGCPLDDKTRVLIKTAEDTWGDIERWYVSGYRFHVPANEWDWEWNRGLGETDIVAFSFFIDDEEH